MATHTHTHTHTTHTKGLDELMETREGRIADTMHLYRLYEKLGFHNEWSKSHVSVWCVCVCMHTSMCVCMCVCVCVCVQECLNLTVLTFFFQLSPDLRCLLQEFAEHVQGNPNRGDLIPVLQRRFGQRRVCKAQVSSSENIWRPLFVVCLEQEKLRSALAPLGLKVLMSFVRGQTHTHTHTCNMHIIVHTQTHMYIHTHNTQSRLWWADKDNSPLHEEVATPDRQLRFLSY